MAIVGAGAAGLATAIFARRLNRTRSVLLLDGARKLGAKILISGGGRCNVTNVTVADTDFRGGRSTIVRRILRGLPVSDTIAFFHEIGVRLHEEPGGKLFPDSHRARDVLDALVREVDVVGATLCINCRVVSVRREDEAFLVDTSQGPMRAAAVVLATGGQSLPKTGSDGFGFEIARSLGHTIVPTTPALVPLVLAESDEDGRMKPNPTSQHHHITPSPHHHVGGSSLHRELSGVSHGVEFDVWIDGAIVERLAGALLWTHFGISGPVVLNASRHWLRAQAEGRAVAITASFHPGESFEQVDERWTALSIERPAMSVQNALATTVPASVAIALLRVLAIDGTVTLAHFPRVDRRRLVHALVRWPVPVVGTRGYNYAEVTAGGVALGEIDPATMESRACPGLFLVGEILDVDGRIGGFNFQWAWSSAYVAARALAARSCGQGPSR